MRQIRRIYTDLNTIDYQELLKKEICDNLYNPCYPCAKSHFDTAS